MSWQSAHVPRSREVTQQDRQLRKMLEKTDWYKKVRINKTTRPG